MHLKPIMMNMEWMVVSLETEVSNLFLFICYTSLSPSFLPTLSDACIQCLVSSEAEVSNLSLFFLVEFIIFFLPAYTKWCLLLQSFDLFTSFHVVETNLHISSWKTGKLLILNGQVEEDVYLRANQYKKFRVTNSISSVA